MSTTTTEVTEATEVEPHGTTETEPPAETPPAQEDTTDWKAEARKWEKQSKSNKTAAEERDALKDALAKALGTNDNDGDPDPAQLTQQLTEKDAIISTLQAENLVLRHAGKVGGNPETLLDSRRFADSLSEIDLGDEKAITEHIKAFVRDNPSYAAPGGTPGSRDAGAGHGHSTKPLDSIPAGVPRLAAALEQEMAGKNRK